MNTLCIYDIHLKLYILVNFSANQWLIIKLIIKTNNQESLSTFPKHTVKQLAVENLKLNTINT